MKIGIVLCLGLLFLGCAKSKKPGLPPNDEPIGVLPAIDNGSDAPSSPVTVLDEGAGSDQPKTQPATGIPGLIKGFPTDIYLDSNILQEHSEPGLIIGRFTGPDEEATYQLMSDNGLFLNIIQDDVGFALVSTGGIDLETRAPGEEAIAVKSISSAGLTQTMMFPISIADINEAPTDLLFTTMPNAENGQFLRNEKLFQLEVVDPDRNQQFEISVKSIGILEGHLFDNPKSLINADSSSMSLIAHQDWEISSFIITVVASDGEHTIEKSLNFLKMGFLPQNCRDIKNMFGSQDGKYWLFIDGMPQKPWFAQCHNMSAAESQTLIPISGEKNISSRIGLDGSVKLMRYNSIIYLGNEGDNFIIDQLNDPFQDSGNVDFGFVVPGLGGAIGCQEDDIALSLVNLEGTAFQLTDGFEDLFGNPLPFKELGEPQALQNFEIGIKPVAPGVCAFAKMTSRYDHNTKIHLLYNRSFLSSVIEAR